MGVRDQAGTPEMYLFPWEYVRAGKPELVRSAFGDGTGVDQITSLHVSLGVSAGVPVVYRNVSHVEVSFG
jgi:hypothetical protein